MENLVPALTLIFGAILGGVVAWLAFRGKARRAFDDGKREAMNDMVLLQERLVAKQTALDAADSKVARSEEKISNLQRESASLNAQLAAAEVRLTEQNKASRDKLEFKDVLKSEFQVLASEILDEKSARFSEQSKMTLEPLEREIKEFRERVVTTYQDEALQRVSLKTEIEKLRELNERMDQDAIELTNALKGQSKTLGDWGEFILEDILQKAGLVRNREYSIRENLVDEEGKRSQPDVIVNLPDQRHLIIDSKANLTAYKLYCAAEDKVGCERELKKHIAAVREQIKKLDLRAYQDHYKLNSLDFVLMFIPLEPAFIVAVRHDPTLFDDAFQKRIVVVCPSTLLASMRTVGNIWKQEYQKQNFLEIANQAGALYDKFVAFNEDLKAIGQRLAQAQTSYEAAANKLVSGKGNLVRRAEHILELGAKASKRLPQNVVAAAMNVEEEPARGIEEGLFPEFKPGNEQTTEEAPPPEVWKTASGEG